ncbi:MAG: outer membrane lipoprotein carrier protein LolA [Niabella sp.]
MKKLFFTGAILLTSVLSFAQRDPKAKAILDQVSAKFKTYTSLVANFSYQITNAAGKVMATKKGTVQMKGSKYAIDLGGNKIMSDGVTVWNYDPSAKEVTVNSANASENTISPQKLFTDFYNKDFKYVLDKDSKVGGRDVNKIVMQPLDRNKPIERLYIAIDKATKNIISTTVIEKSGNRYVYSLSNFKPNSSIADGVFSFDKAKYPGVEVVDLR